MKTEKLKAEDLIWKNGWSHTSEIYAEHDGIKYSIESGPIWQGYYRLTWRYNVNGELKCFLKCFPKFEQCKQYVLDLINGDVDKNEISMGIYYI